MDGLEDQAEAEAQRLIQRIYTHQRLEISHSSRDSLVHRITSAIIHAAQNNAANNEASPMIVTRVLVLRSGISVTGLGMLQRALEEQARHKNNYKDSMKPPLIRELEFVGLRSVEEVAAAIACCHGEGVEIERLCLRTFHMSPLQTSEPLVYTIRDGIFGREEERNDGEIAPFSDESRSAIKVFELEGYPVGTTGAQILADAVAHNSTLDVLRLMDCELRSDAAKYIAQMIRFNHHLKELDLSYNRHYLGSPLTREMTIKTLVQRGLKYNLTLRELGMRQAQGLPSNMAKIDQQLAMNRFRYSFVQNKLNPFAIPTGLWALLLGRVSSKPAVLHLMLCDGAVAMFEN